MHKISTNCTAMALLALLLMLPSTAACADDPAPPEAITIDALQHLYEPVVFDHAMHSEAFACNRCHHHTAGDGPENDNCGRCHPAGSGGGTVACHRCHPAQPGRVIGDAGTNGMPVFHIDKPALLGALHLKCTGCHRRQGGPTGCRDCHGFTVAGRQRFAVGNP